MQKDKKLIFVYRMPFLSSFVNKYCLWEILELGYGVAILGLSALLELEFSGKNSAGIFIYAMPSEVGTDRIFIKSKIKEVLHKYV